MRHIETAEPCDGLVHGGFNRFCIGNIGAGDRYAISVARDFFARDFKSGSIEIDEHERDAFARKRMCRGAPDAARGARYKCCFSTHAPHVLSLFRWRLFADTCQYYRIFVARMAAYNPA
jgi:hypothetical protein